MNYSFHRVGELVDYLPDKLKCYQNFDLILDLEGISTKKPGFSTMPLTLPIELERRDMATPRCPITPYCILPLILALFIGENILTKFYFQSCYFVII